MPEKNPFGHFPGPDVQAFPSVEPGPHVVEISVHQEADLLTGPRIRRQPAGPPPLDPTHLHFFASPPMTNARSIPAQNV